MVVCSRTFMLIKLEMQNRLNALKEKSVTLLISLSQI